MCRKLQQICTIEQNHGPPNKLPDRLPNGREIVNEEQIDEGYCSRTPHGIVS